MFQNCGIANERVYEKLAAGFSIIEGYEGWMIVRVNYGVETIAEKMEIQSIRQQCIVKKKKARYSILESFFVAEGKRFYMEMHLMKPQEEERMQKKKARNLSEKELNQGLSQSALGNMIDCVTFQKLDIIRFVQRVKDKNPIHQTEEPVVPGLLLLHSMLKLLMGQKLQRIEIWFRNPVFAGERIMIYEQQKNKKYVGVREERIEIFQFSKKE